VSLGPDGIAYQAGGNEVTAFDTDGVRAGWPIQVDGEMSFLAFGPDGRIYLTSSTPEATRLLVFDRDGRALPIGSDPLPIEPTRAWSGSGTSNRPIAPLVAPDGTAYVVGEADAETVVYGINAAGAVMDGWPYRDPATLPWQGSCPSESAGCGVARTLPAVGNDGTLYLPVEAVGPASGGSLVALGRDGRVIPGWPVGLVRSGADFWSVVAAPGQTAFALAVEPEPSGSTSATILDIAIDSAVRYRESVVVPGGG
jgi:outer membrane protein assembly factor BamB